MTLVEETYVRSSGFHDKGTDVRSSGFHGKLNGGLNKIFILYIMNGIRIVGGRCEISESSGDINS